MSRPSIYTLQRPLVPVSPELAGCWLDRGDILEMQAHLNTFLASVHDLEPRKAFTIPSHEERFDRPRPSTLEERETWRMKKLMGGAS